MWKKYKAFFISMAAFSLLIVTIFLIGAGSDIRPDADFVITYRQVDSLDYITQQGQTNQFVTPSIEGLIAPQSDTSDNKGGGEILTPDVSTNWPVDVDAEVEGTEVSNIDPNSTGVPLSVWQIADMMSNEYCSGGVYSTSGLRNPNNYDFDSVGDSYFCVDFLVDQAEHGNDNVILALSNWTQYDWLTSTITSGGGTTSKEDITSYNVGAFYQPAPSNEDYYSRSFSMDPTDLSGSSANLNTWDTDSSKWTPTYIDDYVFGLADSIYSNPDMTSWTVKLKSNENNSYSWYTVGDTEGEQVSARDFAFGIEQQVRISNGAASAYQIVDYSNINGARECSVAQSEVSENGGNPDYWGDADNDGLPEIPECYYLVVDDQEYETLTPEQRAMVGVIYEKDGVNTVGDEIEYILSAPTPYFPTLMINSSFYPVDYSWWTEMYGNPDNGEDKSMATGSAGSSTLFGTSATQFRSNGAYYIESYNATYETVFIKNPYYPSDTNGDGAQLQQADKWIYRVSEEPATQVTLFKNGYSSYSILDDSVSSAVTNDPQSAQFIQATLSAPNTRYFMFNISGDSTTGNSDYVLNDNFRRSMQYAMNRTDYLTLNGNSTAYPGSGFTPMSMGSAYMPASGGQSDFVDFTSEMQYKAYPGDDESLNNVGGMDEHDRRASLSMTESELNDPTNSVNRIDSNQDVDAAVYYYNAFVSDMKSQGKNVPEIGSDEKIQLELVSKDANTDSSYKALNSSLEKLGIPVVIIPTTAPGTSFWTEYYSGENWDIMTLQWNPDYTDPLAFLSLLLTPDFTRKSNNSAGWTFLDGDSPGEAEAANTMAYDDVSESGIKYVLRDTDAFNMYFGSTEFSDIYEPTKGLTHFDENGNMTENTIALSPTDSLANWNAAVSNLKNILSYTYEISEPSVNEEYYKTINSSDFWTLSNEERFLYYTILELMIKDGAPFITLANETVSTTASRLVFMTQPPVGYANYTYAYDCRDAGPGMPDCDDLFWSQDMMSEFQKLLGGIM